MMIRRKGKAKDIGDYTLAYVYLYTYAGDKAKLLGLTLSTYQDADKLESMILRGLGHG